MTTFFPIVTLFSYTSLLTVALFLNNKIVLLSHTNCCILGHEVRLTLSLPKLQMDVRHFIKAVKDTETEMVTFSHTQIYVQYSNAITNEYSYHFYMDQTHAGKAGKL